MKKITTFLIIWVTLLPSVFAQAGRFTPADSAVYFNNAFEAGEKLIFKVKYGFIPGGYAYLTTDIKKIGYDWYYAASAKAITSGVVGQLAEINDRYESYFSISTGLPIRAVRDIRENSYRKFNEVIFVRDKNIVRSLTTGEQKVPPGTLDILSAFYYARRHIFTHPLKKNEVIALRTFFDEELYDVVIKFKKAEKIKTKFGKINCLRFGPVLDEKSPFEKEDDLKIWFSDDGNFIPIKIRLKMGVGNVKVDLIKYSGLKNPFGQKFIRDNGNS